MRFEHYHISIMRHMRLIVNECESHEIHVGLNPLCYES